MGLVVFVHALIVNAEVCVVVHVKISIGKQWCRSGSDVAIAIALRVFAFQVCGFARRMGHPVEVSS